MTEGEHKPIEEKNDKNKGRRIVLDERGWGLLEVAYQSDEPVLQALVSDITTALHAIVNVQVKELCW